MSLASAALTGFSSTLGVSTASSSLDFDFAAFFAEPFGLDAFFLVDVSAGVLGVDSFNLVPVFGVFAG